MLLLGYGVINWINENSYKYERPGYYVVSNNLSIKQQFIAQEMFLSLPYELRENVIILSEDEIARMRK